MIMKQKMIEMKTKKKAIVVALTMVLATSVGLAATDSKQQKEESGEAVAKLDRMNVVGNVEKAQVISGSASFLEEETLEKHNYRDVMRALRQVPGVYVVEEEGFGLRPNIGIRGSGTARSSRINLMEDGLLIAPAPYAAPAAYYFPTQARINSMEVIKGAGSVRMGPRTTGGTLNLISTPIPHKDIAGLVDFSYGSENTSLAHAWVGGQSDVFGWLLETVQQNSDGFKKVDGGGDSGYNLQDYMGKVRMNLAEGGSHFLELKVVKTEQDSDETYLGLTDTDFLASPIRRYAASHLDNIKTDHEQFDLRHYIAFSGNVDLTSVIYHHDFSRNWYKLNDVNKQSISRILANPDRYADEISWIRGADSPDNVMRLRNNNRSYNAKGFQSILGLAIDGDSVSNDLEFGIRYHKDYEDRFQDNDRYRMENGRLVLTDDGAPGSHSNRVSSAKAWAFYLQDTISVGDFLITPGVRYEKIDLERVDYLKQVDGRDFAPTKVRSHEVSAVVPGVGVTWLFNSDINLFASVHKGFNPPGPGSTSDPEESVNTEIGLRWNQGTWQAELIGFFNDYSNLVGTCTNATGGDCQIGEQFDGGEAEIAGLEAVLKTDFGSSDGLSIPFQLGYTLTNAEFSNDFSSSFKEWGNVTKGDELPYLPKQTANMSIGVEAGAVSAYLSASFFGVSRIKAGNGPIPYKLKTSAATVWDLAVGYQINDIWKVNARIENLSDEVYIASRRPAGVRSGIPRTGYIGIKAEF